MKVCQVKYDKENWWGDVSELDNYDLDRLKNFGAEEVYYYYYQGSYEGSGEILVKKNGKWAVKSLSHCSCYGPLEDLEQIKFVDNLEEISEKSSKEYHSDILPLIEEARK